MSIDLHYNYIMDFALRHDQPPHTPLGNQSVVFKVNDSPGFQVASCGWKERVRFCEGVTWWLSGRFARLGFSYLCIFLYCIKW